MFLCSCSPRGVTLLLRSGQTLRTKDERAFGLADFSHQVAVLGQAATIPIRLRKKAIQDLGRTGLQARRADGRPKHKLLSVLGRASGRGGRVCVKASNSESRGCAALLAPRPDGVSGESLRLSGAAATPLFIHHYSTPPRKGRAFPHSGAAQPLVFTQTLKPRPFGARAPTLFPHPAMCCAHVAVVIPGP